VQSADAASSSLRQRVVRPLQRAAVLDAQAISLGLVAAPQLALGSAWQSQLIGESAPPTALLSAAEPGGRAEPRGAAGEGAGWPGALADAVDPLADLAGALADAVDPLADGRDARTPARPANFASPLDAPSLHPPLQPLKPPPTPDADPQPVATITAERDAAAELAQPEDLDQLAGKIKRILDEEARRYGIEV
jgi:hypothetical protein